MSNKPRAHKTNKKPVPQRQSQAFDFNAAIQQAMALHKEGHFQEALDIYLRLAQAHPGSGDAWGNAAVNCVWLGRWRDTIRYGEAALARGCDRLDLFHVLAHAHSELGQWPEARRYGLEALTRRDRLFDGQIAPPPHNLPALPPPPSAQTRENNIIAFSLFGANSKYCEAAVLNVQDQPTIYPHWMCRFYVDNTVPENVIARLKRGARVVRVDGPAAKWPGPMWRFLALDDRQAHRILFRDADSVISRREAAAVEEWLTSGKRFHIMRDWGSHTELILAGLWGMVAGSLPPLDTLIQPFMNAPLESEHFADQFFLRQYVWPYARASLMQHDSVFGFLDSVPFPDRERPQGFHVGCMECVPVFSLKANWPDGSEVVWTLSRIEKGDDGQNREEAVCSYPARVKDGEVRAHIPERYARWIEQGKAGIRLVKNGL